MQIDLCCNPHTIRVTTNFLVAIRFCSSGKDHYLLFVTSCWSFDKQCFIVLVFSPVTLSAEDPFQSHSVTVTYIHLCVGCSGSCCKVDSVWCGLQFMCKRKHIINCFSCSNSSLGYIVRTFPTLSDIFLMFLRKVIMDGFLSGDITDCCHRFHLLYRPSPQFPDCYQ